jgi:hypothetical protein
MQLTMFIAKTSDTGALALIEFRSSPTPVLQTQPADDCNAMGASATLAGRATIAVAPICSTTGNASDGCAEGIASLRSQ